MAVLIVELHGSRRGSVLPGRVLIGRRPMNHLVLDDAAVSRLHAWIDGEGDRFYINDAGSRTGTRVNGQRVVARHLLGDEDEITIGPARLTFLAEPRLRPGVEALDLSAGPATPDDGILFPCPSCAAPLWAGKDFGGRTGQCRYCGRDMVVPRPKNARVARAARVRAGGEQPAREQPVGNGTAASPPLPPRAPLTEDEARLSPGADDRDPRDAFRDPLPTAAPAAVASAPAPREPTAARRPVSPAAPAAATAAPPETPRRRDLDQVCGVCQSPISVFEEQTACPSCGLVFHAECWAENYGCSAYGCSQVNALKPPESNDNSGGAAAADPALSADGGDAAKAAGEGSGLTDGPNRFPWEFLLLAGSVFSALLGALTFGLPSLALAGGTIAWMARTRGNAPGTGPHRGIVLLSTGLAVLGMLTGAAVSYFLYFGGPHS